MNIVEALARRSSAEPDTSRVYTDEEREALVRMARAGGSMGVWARFELERIKAPTTEVLGSTN